MRGSTEWYKEMAGKIQQARIDLGFVVVGDGILAYIEKNAKPAVFNSTSFTEQDIIELMENLERAPFHGIADLEY